MFNQISRLFKSSTVAVAILFLSSCGGGTSSTTQGGSIVINPDKIDWKITPIGCTGADVNYSKVLISVFSATGAPVANVPVTVSLDLSTGTYNGGFAYLTLYDDPTWVAGSGVPPTNAVGGSYTTQVGSDGTKMLEVGVDLGCEYGGNLNAYSGTLYQVMNINVHK